MNTEQQQAMRELGEALDRTWRDTARAIQEFAKVWDRELPWKLAYGSGRQSKTTD